MRTFAEVEEWCRGAIDAYGDPSEPVCQLFFRWSNTLQRIDVSDDTLVCGLSEGAVALVLGTNIPALPLPVRTGEPVWTVDEVISYGAVRVVDGVWAIEPSVHVERFIHGFVVLYGVPDPAPWERLVVLP